MVTESRRVEKTPTQRRGLHTKPARESTRWLVDGLHDLFRRFGLVPSRAGSLDGLYGEEIETAATKGQASMPEAAQSHMGAIAQSTPKLTGRSTCVALGLRRGEPTSRGSPGGFAPSSEEVPHLQVSHGNGLPALGPAGTPNSPTHTRALPYSPAGTKSNKAPQDDFPLEIIRAPNVCPEAPIQRFQETSLMLYYVVANAWWFARAGIALGCATTS